MCNVIHTHTQAMHFGNSDSNIIPLFFRFRVLPDVDSPSLNLYSTANEVFTTFISTAAKYYNNNVNSIGELGPTKKEIKLMASVTDRRRDIVI
jgi:hypothetical protein